jgi:hypothetical protein
MNLALHKKWGMGLKILFLAPIAASLLSFELHAATWMTESIDEQKFFALGRYSGLSDQQGAPHVFYGGSHLLHTYLEDGEWETEIVDSSAQTGDGAIALIDDEGRFHILYQDFYDLDSRLGSHLPGIKYAHGTIGNWTVEFTPFPVDGLGNGRGSIDFEAGGSIALDSSGKLHFAYKYEGGLFHAVKSGSSWDIEEIDAISGGDHVSIGIDSNNKVHISYIDQNLRYATNSTGLWTFEDVHDAEIRSDFLLVDSQDDIYICYGYEGAVYCKNNSAGDWTEEVIESGLGYLPIIQDGRFDSNGKLHILYYIKDGRAPDYMKYANNKSGAWEISAYTFGPRFDASFINLIFMPGDDVATFFMPQKPNYHFMPEAPLQYVVWDGSTWSSEIVDYSQHSDRAPGLSSSIAVDSNGKSHVVYITDEDYPNYSLHYANNLSSSWEHIFLDDDVTEEARLASPVIGIDSDDFVHIVYSSLESGFYVTNYMTNRTGVWERQLISNDYIAAGKYAMFIDADDIVHISYVTNGNINHSGAWQVRYANNSTGTWVDEMVHQYDDSAMAPFEISRHDPWPAVAVTVADDGNPQVAFMRAHGSTRVADDLRRCLVIPRGSGRIRLGGVFHWIQYSLDYAFLAIRQRGLYASGL